MPMEVEWDANKAKSNLRKHGVRFADAVRCLTIPGICRDRIGM